MVLKPLKNAKNFASGGACGGLFCLRRRLRRAFLPPAAPAAGFFCPHPMYQFTPRFRVTRSL